MKKLLPGLVLISLALATVAFAVDLKTPETCTMDRTINLGDMITCPEGDTPELGTEQGICCVFNTLYNIVDWIFIVLIAVAALLIVIGAFSIMTSGGDPEKTKSGRNWILYAAIGLVVAFVAKAIPPLVMYMMGIRN